MGHFCCFKYQKDKDNEEFDLKFSLFGEKHYIIAWRKEKVKTLSQPDSWIKELESLEVTHLISFLIED